MIHVCLQWQELTWDLIRLAWFKYSYSRDMRFLTYDLSSIYLIFVLASALITQDAYDGGNESSKLISTIIFGRFMKLAITTSLCKGPFFYFYVESSSSTFMHRLREHSYHSEYNVHSPKIYYDWFIIMVLLVLKLFVSSHPLELWRCPMHLCFATPWGTSWISLCYVSICFKQTCTFQWIITHDLLFVLLFML
jgi:hypothetical protein